MQHDIDVINAMAKELAETPRWTEDEMSLAKRGFYFKFEWHNKYIIYVYLIAVNFEHYIYI